MRILVTDGDNRAALAIVRTLGRAGHQMVVGEKHLPALAAASRYSTASLVYPDPVTASADFVSALAAVVREQRIDVLLPVSDITTFLVTRNRERFAASCAIPFADAATVERAADKTSLMQTAQRLGVPTPATIVVTDPAHVPVTPWEYPIVIKPRQSRVLVDGRWVSSAVDYASDRDDLLRKLAARPAHEFPLMLQERIVGPGMGVFACYAEGRPVAFFSHRRLRERPPWGGVSVLSESIAVDPVARGYATTLLDELGWHGIAMVEFKVDARDGSPRLMEINGRFWGSLQLAIDAGVDFPALLLLSAARQPLPSQPAYRAGVRSRWLWGDIDSLLLTLFGGRRAPAGWQPDRLGAVLRFLRLWDGDTCYDNPRRDDVRPWLLETARRFGWRPASAAVGTGTATVAGAHDAAALPNALPGATRE
jgi:predicted ATP-grasp superfamily ATP-dependent carboligase